MAALITESIGAGELNHSIKAAVISTTPSTSRRDRGGPAMLEANRCAIEERISSGLGRSPSTAAVIESTDLPLAYRRGIASPIDGNRHRLQRPLPICECPVEMMNECRAESVNKGENQMTDTVEVKNVVSVAEIRANVEVDKARGLEAIERAGHELQTYQQLTFPTDITGKPDVNAAYSRFKREQLRSLQTVHRTPYYCRLNTTVTIDGEKEELQVLISKARETGGVVDGDGWLVVSWTSPLANLIEGKRPNDVVELKGRRSKVEYLVKESTKYESLLPQFENGEFFFFTGDAAVAKEADLDVSTISATSLNELPAKEYTAKPSFGLSDIIVMRDEPQREAMALPFADSVVIEGPPGSGKTSIGIMRIAALYDRQWEERGLERDRDRPFHDYSSMRVLVYNDEMVEYLKGLAQSIGVEHVQVNTIYDFFRRICRQTKLLSGTARKDRPSLSVIKGRREALSAFFAGFQAHATRYWVLHCDSLRSALFALGPDFLVLADRLAEWIDRVGKAKLVDGQIIGSIGVAGSVSTAADAIRLEQSPTRRAMSPDGNLAPKDNQSSGIPVDLLQKRLASAKQLVEDFINGACNRADATRAMFGVKDYVDLKQRLETEGVPARTIRDADRLWRKQYAGALPAYSELDLAMCAWLGAKLLLLPDAPRKPWIGGQLDRLSHIVVDEVQDLSPTHLGVLASQIAAEGTMTLVGDLHQNLNPYAGLQRWEDLNLPGVRRTAFGVNHRQTLQLGTFMKSLHSRLFSEPCVWEPSSKTAGPLPRAGAARSWKTIASAIAAETRIWRENIEGTAGATVAVLYDGRLTPKRLNWLKKKIEYALRSDLITVEVATPGSGGEALRRTDRVVIASVRQTKGLEFDAVIFIEPKARWSKPLEEIELRLRNGFYVATSRARAGLSVCMSNLPDCFEAIASEGLCESVIWDEEKSQ